MAHGPRRKMRDIRAEPLGLTPQLVTERHVLSAGRHWDLSQ